MYQSSAVLEVQEKFKENPYLKGYSKSTPIFKRMGSIVQRLKSRSMIEDVIKELHLDENIGNEVKYRELVERIRDNVTISITSNSLLEIKCLYPDRFDCQKIVNLLTRKIIKENLELQEKETATGIQWLNKEIALCKDKLDKAEEALAKFRTSYADLLPDEVADRLYSNLVVQNPFSNQPLKPNFQPADLRAIAQSAHTRYSLKYNNISQSLMNYGIELKDLEKTRITLLQQLEGADEYILSSKITETSPVIKSLRKELVGKEIQLAKLKVDSTEEHPLVRRLIREIDNLHNSLKAASEQSTKEETTSINPIYQSIKMELSKVERDIQSVKERIKVSKVISDETMRRLKEIPEKQKELNRLNRERFNLNVAYNGLVRVRDSAYITRRMELEERGTNFKIIDNAEVPLRPVKPKRNIIVLAGFFFGLVIGGALIVLAETTDHSFEEPNQLREFLPIPLLGSTSQIITPDERSLGSAKKRLWGVALLIFIGIILLVIAIAVLLGGRG
jgi:uncharacterized protein involved in exopolysaccharide biosynthesis